ncbi:CotH kinase family protein [Schlesneria paludicola]|uniref:CotH kinase family protein n=1 Tax=Schlesneria paludicola TaxID=360056 RepID=UPI00029A15BD|nr:CotH kinase family protein [Schlesneria paludicola]
MIARLITVLGIVAFVLVAVFGQSPPERPDPWSMRFGPGGFGPDGFGPGGMVSTQLQSAAITLIGMPDVRSELGVTKEQQPVLDQLIAETQKEARGSMGDMSPIDLLELDDDARDDRLRQMRQKMEKVIEQSDERMAKILTSEQTQRLAELCRQRAGIAAMLKPDMVKQLQLSEDQTARLKQLEESGRPQVVGAPPGGVPGGRPGFGGGPPDFERMEQLRRRAESEAVAVLNDDQQTKWKEMLGKPFSFLQQRMGPGGPERKLLAKFDHDGNHWLDLAERQEARATIKQQGGARGGQGGGPFGGGGLFGGFGPRGGPGRGPREPAKPGPKVSVSDVRNYPEASLYDPRVLRTFFLDFESPDWDAELADFHNSDVDVPATLTVDGVKYPGVGVHFRGMSSYMGVPEGYKHSLNLAVDFIDPKQRLLGQKTLNLLNSHEDPSCMSTVLYSHLARQHIPAPQANYVKLVINGESWGVYVNVQQFNKDFVAENFKSTKGARWKVRGSPGGGGGLEYLGEDIDDYRRRYEIKSDDNEKSWRRLVALCKALNETPAGQLVEVIEPMLDVEGLLWFLALDNTLINNDGYWVRASDYSIFLDGDGRFHIVPHDMNEAFRGAMMMGPPGGRGGPRGPRGGPGGPPPNAQAGRGEPGPRSQRGRGPRGGGVELDPLIGMDDSSKPLRSKILAVPAYRKRYLQHVYELADQSLDWKSLGPVVAQFKSLIEDELRADTRKLESFEAFERVTADERANEDSRGHEMALRAFAEDRRAYLLKHPEVKKAIP